MKVLLQGCQLVCKMKLPVWCIQRKMKNFLIMGWIFSVLILLQVAITLRLGRNKLKSLLCNEQSLWLLWFWQAGIYCHREALGPSNLALDSVDCLFHSCLPSACCVQMKNVMISDRQVFEVRQSGCGLGTWFYPLSWLDHGINQEKGIQNGGRTIKRSVDMSCHLMWAVVPPHMTWALLSWLLRQILQLCLRNHNTVTITSQDCKVLLCRNNRKYSRTWT